MEFVVVVQSLVLACVGWALVDAIRERNAAREKFRDAMDELTNGKAHERYRALHLMFDQVSLDNEQLQAEKAKLEERLEEVCGDIS